MEALQALIATSLKPIAPFTWFGLNISTLDLAGTVRLVLIMRQLREMQAAAVAKDPKSASGPVRWDETSTVKDLFATLTVVFGGEWVACKLFYFTNFLLNFIGIRFTTRASTFISNFTNLSGIIRRSTRAGSVNANRAIYVSPIRNPIRHPRRNHSCLSHNPPSPSRRPQPLQPDRSIISVGPNDHLPRRSERRLFPRQSLRHATTRRHPGKHTSRTPGLWMDNG